MTPKTAYQKMRDNRVRRESIAANKFHVVSVELPKNPKVGEVVRVRVGDGDKMRASIDPMSTVLEDGSILTASGPMQNDPHAELRKTWASGQRWQWKAGESIEWSNCLAEPLWHSTTEYRRHPDDIDQPKALNEDQPEGWIFWLGGPMPVESTTSVTVKLADGLVMEGVAGSFGWWHDDGDSGNIIAYKVVA